MLRLIPHVIFHVFLGVLDSWYFILMWDWYQQEKQRCLAGCVIEIVKMHHLVCTSYKMPAENSDSALKSVGVPSKSYNRYEMILPVAGTLGTGISILFHFNTITMSSNLTWLGQSFFFQNWYSWPQTKKQLPSNLKFHVELNLLNYHKVHLLNISFPVDSPKKTFDMHLK